MYDMFGRVIKIGDIIACPHEYLDTSRIGVALVVGLNRRIFIEAGDDYVQGVYKTRRASKFHFPNRCIIVDDCMLPLNLSKFINELKRELQ